MTKIKGWRNKFIKRTETPPNCEGSQKNLSAFCSNMLDEYLESEAQYISERAAAFTTSSEESVAYQLPVKSSSYVKTLDSVLKHRKAAFKFPAGANKPCPLSHKPLLYSALASPPPPLASPEAAVQPEAPSASSPTQPAAQRLSAGHPGGSQKPAASFGPNHMRPAGLTKLQHTLMQMEVGALHQGLRRTQLTPERLSLALSGLLTKEMVHRQFTKTIKYPKFKTTGPECGQEFCSLGCVCSSLQHLNRASFHCRRPECMFGCACFKRKITKHLSAKESEEAIHPIYSMTNMEPAVLPHPGSFTKKLWIRDHDKDPEPIFIPKSTPPTVLPPVKVVKRSSVRLPQPIREEDKDPVYKYLESMMTCARVREFNSKPPPELNLEPKIFDTSTPNTAAKPQNAAADNVPKKDHGALLDKKTAEKYPQEMISGEKEAKKQIQIQSVCQWGKDRTMILEALCQRMNQNRLTRPFWVRPYRIRPVAKIFMRKPSGSIVTYRIHISKPAKASDIEEDDSEEEKHEDKSLNGDAEEEDDGPKEEPDIHYGVTPFLCGVLPAGRLKARTKPVGCQEYGLIQVNGKSYNQARLLLGSMGSLHPANRLAAFVTGRLQPPGGISLKITRKNDPANKVTPPEHLHVKTAGTVVPPVVAPNKPADLKPPSQPTAPPFPPAVWRKPSNNLQQQSQNSFPANLFTSAPVGPFQNTSTSSPVSLTVSPSLKTPSFLGQSGTYSFRICPPADGATRGQNLPGVTLPGGFTLIELPKPGANGAATESTNGADVDKAQAQKAALINFRRFAAHAAANWLGGDTLAAAKDLLSSRSVEPGSSSELLFDKKVKSDENNDSSSGQVEPNLDIASEDMSSDSDSSDYGEADEDEEVVDIETVEEGRQGLAIEQMKEAVRKATKESGDSSDGFGSAKDLNTEDNLDLCADNRRRKNHTALERQRRSEQRFLFDKLQTVLQSDPRAPRLRLLSLALKEIQNLVETSKYLEEKKRRLTQLQSNYVKDLSLLSGKSHTLIKNKLKEICERQKMREKNPEWKPFFSNLLQSKAAFLQSKTPWNPLQTKPLLQPDLLAGPSQTKMPTPAAQKLMSLLQRNLPKTPAPPSTELPKLPPASPVPVPSLQGGLIKTEEEQQEIPVALAQVGVATNKTTVSVAATPQIPAVQDGASSVPPTPNASKHAVKPPPSFALPLIRSKTGRIILPSSLKPLGNGFYTLMVMQPKQEGKKDKADPSASGQPSDVDSSTKQDKGLSECDTGSVTEDAVQSSDSNPKRVKAPLAELALLNKSIVLPSVTPKTTATACLSFNRVNEIPATSVEPAPSPPVVRRPRGRPRKRHAAAEDASESETSVLVEEKHEKKTLEVSETPAKDEGRRVIAKPAAGKRPRGRPPKKRKTTQLWSPPVGQARSSPPRANEGSPVGRSRSCKSPDVKAKDGSARRVGASRPLTRGSLGKDFPSAKKRSWIDVEKELEPEMESESESESG